MEKIEIIKQNSKNYPTKLLQIQETPKQLYVEGDTSLLNNDAIAIVGSRKATEYGKKCASYFAKGLAKKGITIISGLATGIDSVAHIHSMKEQGKTIAVIGSGFKHITPKENYYLYEQIIENGGCIVSEYPPETKEEVANYPRRNRIISGLSMGVLVIEARHRSGSGITANLAMKQKKEVFCVPNRIDEKTASGTNNLIKKGANLVTCPEDILEFYDLKTLNEEMEMPKEYKEVYELIGELPISANEIAKITNKSIGKVAESLCMLEIEELIKQVAGNQYVRRYKND